MIDYRINSIVEKRINDVEYVALSYVWGRVGSTNHDLKVGDKLPSSLHQLIQDACNATKSLGCDYIWVHRYCVPKSGPEKHHMINRMGAIYESTVLTVIASSSSSAADGLPGVIIATRLSQ